MMVLLKYSNSPKTWHEMVYCYPCPEFSKDINKAISVLHAMVPIAKDSLLMKFHVKYLLILKSGMVNHLKMIIILRTKQLYFWQV